MKYYVTSNAFGDGIEHFVAMAGGRGARVGAVVNAIDDRAPEVRAQAARRLCTELTELGLRPSELDLRAWFGRDDPASALQDLDAVWFRGGNSFLLRSALALSGVDAVIADAMQAGRVVWGGASAGGIVLGPTLRGVELMNDPARVESTYFVAPRWDGLGIIDQVIVPHFRSEHVESPAADAMVARFEADGTPFHTLRAGESLRSGLRSDVVSR